ncbi:TadE/TadG family type IV pilus assembly protein [Allopusillimonas ginsengisoli]|uniref:TadE/TadG family type IV pilus assembly protein n=1 Tax=Allopusillimonas ginsengisoli TaxID=453575 RepID=UPI001FD70522|nr:TadE/TadG family type IV pilus assembly protein [Allopusillimonas ginsengisoli]
MEFAFVFFIFFVVLYGVLTYGLIFALQQSLNSAAENGARAALKWAPDTPARATNAESEATSVTSWLVDLSHGDALKVVSCYQGGPSCKTDVCPALPAADDLEAGEITVALCYHYNSEQGRLIPLIGPSSIVSLIVPAVLQASATANLQIASQQPAATGE